MVSGRGFGHRRRRGFSDLQCAGVDGHGRNQFRDRLVHLHPDRVGPPYRGADIGDAPAQRSDLFTVTVTDGRGGSVDVAVTVAIAGQCGAGRGAVTVGVPDSGTGVVTGRVTATDADGDSLTFSAPATTGRGSVGINATAGSFTYTPTVAARQNAAARSATNADKMDSFTVAVADGHGSTASIPVTVQVSPSSNPALRHRSPRRRLWEFPTRSRVWSVAGFRPLTPTGMF